MTKFTTANPKPVLQDSILTLDVLNHLDQGITVFDESLRLIAWNRRWHELLDIPEDLAQIHQPLAVFFRFNAERGEYGEGDIEQQVAERLALARRFTPHVFERLRPDGTIIEVRGNPLDNGGFVTTYTDVTEQRQAEARLEMRVKERTEALHQSELWIRQIADAVPALIAYLDKDSCYQFINNMHQEWFGLDGEQLMGQSIFSLVEARNMPQFRRDVAEVLQGKEVQSEYRLRRKERKPLDVSISFIPHFDEQHNMRGYFFLGQDLTEHKQTQRELIESQKMQALGRLTGGIAHDFNNLLTIILGNLNLLEEFGVEALEPQEIHEAVHGSQQAARRGSELIQRMLTFSRRQPLKPEPLCLNTLVQDFLNLLQRTLGETIYIEQYLERDLPAIDVDRNQMETCLLNLALNARDAMPNGGPLTVTTQHYVHTSDAFIFMDMPQGQYVMLTVQDRGEGMSVDTIGRVFEPFFTTKPSGMGTGLGLSMVYGFVKQSGGGIEIDSRLSKGTQVHIIFPAQESLSEQSPAALGEQHVTGYSARILLVEDDAGVRQFVHRTLQKSGYQVALADNGEQALEKLQKTQAQGRHYDLVLTDIIMPGSVDGLALYHEIQRIYPQTQVLCMTGYSDQLEATLAECHLLRKPFERPQLVSKLQALLTGL